MCIKCGVALRGGRGGHLGTGDGRIAPSNSPRDPVLMGILSGCCIAGLGQILLGQTVKGIVLLLASIAFAVLTMGMSVFVMWPAMGIDAYLIAKKLKEGNTVGQWEFF